MCKFEKVRRTDDGIIPVRGTKYSAGYDLYACEDTFIPSLAQVLCAWDVEEYMDKCHNLVDLAIVFKNHPEVRPTLVPTGIKAKLDSDCYLSISARSSLPYKSLLIVANAPGIIDADYYNNSNNEGEIFIQLLNLSPYDILIKKGDKLAQGVIQRYVRVEGDEVIIGTERTGGFGSTGE